MSTLGHPSPGISPADRNRAVIAGFLGWTLDAFDFALVPIASTAIAKDLNVANSAVVQGAWGVVPAHLTELAPDSVRGFLPGFGYQCGALISGTLPFLQESLAESLPRPCVMAVTCVVVFVFGALVVYLGHERKGRHFGGEEQVLSQAARRGRTGLPALPSTRLD
jgi:MFS transporter, SHS family, lactate transporter